MKNSDSLMIAFSRSVIERSSSENRGLVEVTAEMAPEFGIEPEEVLEYLTENLKADIKAEAIRLKLVRVKPDQEGLGSFLVI